MLLCLMNPVKEVLVGLNTNPRINLDVVVLSAKYGEGRRANVFASFAMGVRSEHGDLFL